MRISFIASCIYIVAALATIPRTGEADMRSDVKQLCRRYVEGFGSDKTNLCYHHRLNGPKGIGALSSPEEIARRMVAGKDMPYGYGSGIQDAALENGQFLFALCDAYEATKNEYFADTARWIFAGMKLVATASPVAGFVPRGPHPDGKSYYPNSSVDQHSTFVYALWRYYRSPLATEEDRSFIADTLNKVARRMEKNGWAIKVEDDSEIAHVGFCWLQKTCVGAEILLSVLGAVCDATGDSHWKDLYERFGREDDGIRWRLLDASSVEKWRSFTLYSNQFAVGLCVILRTEQNEVKRKQIKDFLRSLAERALRSNVFDESCWRRLDWAGDWSETEIEENLKPFGLSLRDRATVFDIYGKFDPAIMGAKDWKRKKINEKLCFGIPTVAFHNAVLSEDARLAQEAAPCIRRMVSQMLEHGGLYTSGENFNRTVVLGLHLVALKR